MNSARNQRPRKASTMVRLCCIYWKYTGDEGWCNGGLSRFPTKWTVFEIVLEDTSELVESAFGPVLYSAPNGFCPI